MTTRLKLFKVLVSLRAWCSVMAVLLFSAAVHAQLPEVTVSNVRRVFHNGEHNAFTDLIRFGDAYYLTFRSCPDGHMVHPTASVIILRSRDLEAWEQVHRFSVPLRDTRDPHFLEFQDQLFVYTGTWYSGATTLDRADYDLNKHLGNAVSSTDGTDWTTPQMLEGTFGHYVWKAASFDGRAFLCGRRKRNFAMAPRGEGVDVESAMLVSEDGLIWKKHSLFQETQGDETAFQFDDSGTILGVGRRGSGPAQLLRAEPPYSTWTRVDLDRYIGGPLLTRWADRWVVGGRITEGKSGPRTVLHWLVDGRLHPFAELPSAGDNSYPGFIALSPTEAVVSWYSSHETDASGQPITAIYMANLSLQPAKPQQTERSLFEFTSSFDGSTQAAYLTIPTDATGQPPGQPRPMVVSLHSWSGDLEQRNEDLEQRVAARGWYCLQPNFRGVNERPEACASPAAQQDILDAIASVEERYAIDSTRVYLTGSSGGGHMTMMMAARYPQRWTAASAWVGISDLVAWHEKHADGRYGAMLRACCGGAPGDSPAVDEQYRMRSPLTYIAAAKNVALDIAAGIHDGHDGSVPIRHSLDAFNRIAAANDAAQITADEIAQLSAKDGRLLNPEPNDEGFDFSFHRNIYLRRHANRARVTVFEGGHEGIASAAMAWFDAHPTQETIIER